MASLEEYHDLWAGDCKIDITKISRESANVPFLHHKYYTKLNKEKLKLLKFKADLLKLERDKDLYYRGILDPEELKALGWRPCALKIRPAELSKTIEHDDDIIEASLKIGYQNEIVNFLDSIIREINSRSFHIKNIIEQNKFENGGY